MQKIIILHKVSGLCYLFIWNAPCSFVMSITKLVCLCTKRVLRLVAWTKQSWWKNNKHTEICLWICMMSSVKKQKKNAQVTHEIRHCYRSWNKCQKRNFINGDWHKDDTVSLSTARVMRTKVLPTALQSHFMQMIKWQTNNIPWKICAFWTRKKKPWWNSDVGNIC